MILNFRAMAHSILHIKTFEGKAEELKKALEFAYQCGAKAKEKELRKDQ